MSELPVPDAEAQAHSEQLQQVIKQAIDNNGGSILFSQFMQMALYEPRLGYYVAGARKFGESGDFVTAPEISPLFSRCLARQSKQVLDEIGQGDILEFGAGTGTMASDLLLELERLESLPEQYFIMELSPDLKQRQRQTLEQRAPHLLSRVSWLDALPTSGFNGVILANEVVDAMPVELLHFDDKAVQQRYVGYDETGFFWLDQALKNSELAERLTTVEKEVGDVFCPGYVTEFNLAQTGWVNSIAGMLEKGVALLIDYGFPQHEYYHPDRGMGTLMCHYRHRAHSDPLTLVGLQDLTAHVDFSALAQAAFDSGMDVMGYTSQAQFLLATGITELAAEIDSADTLPYLKMTQQIKKLTLPNEMGELFKVLAVGRGMSGSLQGFMLQDRRQRL